MHEEIRRRALDVFRAEADAKTTGRVTATAGKASFKSATAAGSVTLSQEDGKEMLTFVTADGRSSAKLQRVK